MLEACRELSACFEQAHWKALLAACAVFHPPVIGMASKLSLSRAELTRLLTLITYYDDDGRHFRGPSGRDDTVNTIPWHYDPLGSTETAVLADLPLVAPFDPNLLHILVRVRFRDALLFSAHGTWAPRAPRTEAVPLPEDSQATIDLAMTPAAPTLTTPATLFGHPEGDECIGLGADDAVNDTWRRRTDVARTEQLGTAFSEFSWGETQRQACLATDAFQVDIRLVHVHPTCKKGEPRDMRWANLCTNAAHFRTEADWNGEVPSSGIHIEGNKTSWRISAALPFDTDGLFGESADGIFYDGSFRVSPDHWLEVNFDLETTLQPWSSSSQVHAVRSASLGINGGMNNFCHALGAMNSVPSHIEFEGDTHGWQV